MVEFSLSVVFDNSGEFTIGPIKLVEASPPPLGLTIDYISR
jgi:hypothetical protein